MDSQEDALRLFEKFHQYDWDEEKGWVPNEQESKKMAEKVIDEIVRELDGIQCIHRISHYERVRKELRKI